MRFSRLTRWFRGWFRRSTKPSRNRHETVHETITKPSVLKFYGGGGGEKNKKKYKVNFLQGIKGRSRAIMGRSIDRSIIDRSIDRSIDRLLEIGRSWKMPSTGGIFRWTASFRTSRSDEYAGNKGCWKSAGPGKCRPPAFNSTVHYASPPLSQTLPCANLAKENA